jgi:hypothetical protein
MICAVQTAYSFGRMVHPTAEYDDLADRVAESHDAKHVEKIVYVVVHKVLDWWYVVVYPVTYDEGHGLEEEDDPAEPATPDQVPPSEGGYVLL